MALPIWHRNREGEDDTGGAPPPTNDPLRSPSTSPAKGSSAASSLFPKYHSATSPVKQTHPSSSGSSFLRLRPRGVICVIRHRDHEPFTQRDQDILSRVAAFIGLATYTHAATDATVRELKQRRDTLFAATHSLQLGTSLSARAEEQAHYLAASQQVMGTGPVNKRFLFSLPPPPPLSPPTAPAPSFLPSPPTTPPYQGRDEVGGRKRHCAALHCV